ncbi:MAG: cohesin domain-containing protein [Candidatus Micrarchaeia archaeon]
MRKKILYLWLIFFSPLFSQIILYLSPERISEQTVGSQFTIKLRIKNAPALQVWQAKICFDPQVLKVTTVVKDSFLQNAWYQSLGTIFTSSIENDLGYVLLGETYFPPPPDSGAIGEGPLAKITFEVKNAGSSPIKFEEREVWGVGYSDVTYLGGDPNLSICLPFNVQHAFYGTEDLPSPPGHFMINKQDYPYKQYLPCIVYNNISQFLVSWESYRSPRTIYAQRISSDGQLKGQNFLLGDIFYNYYIGNMASEGSKFLITNMYRENSSPPPYGNYNIGLIRVDTLGKVTQKTSVCSTSFPRIFRCSI